MPFAYLLWFDFFLIRFIYSISCSHICINHNFFFVVVVRLCSVHVSSSEWQPLKRLNWLHYVVPIHLHRIYYSGRVSLASHFLSSSSSPCHFAHRIFISFFVSCIRRHFCCCLRHGYSALVIIHFSISVTSLKCYNKYVRFCCEMKQDSMGSVETQPILIEFSRSVTDRNNEVLWS